MKGTAESVVQMKWEMREDQSFDNKKRWCWKRYSEHAKKLGTYGTAVHIQGFCHKTGLGVDVYHIIGGQYQV